MNNESRMTEDRIIGTVKAAKIDSDTQYAYITDGKKDYPVTAITIQRMENASDVLVPGKKVSFTVYHGKKDYANDILPIIEATTFNLMDISSLSPELQSLVENFPGSFDLRKSILTTLNQPKYVNLSKVEYIEAYLKMLKGRYGTKDINQDLVVELIEHYWHIKKHS